MQRMRNWDTVRVDTINKNMDRTNEKPTSGKDTLGLTVIAQRTINSSMPKRQNKFTRESVITTWLVRDELGKQRVMGRRW